MCHPLGSTDQGLCDMAGNVQEILETDGIQTILTPLITEKHDVLELVV